MHARSFEKTMKPKRIVVNDRMQKAYVYYLTEPEGENFHAAFRPQLTPQQMLQLGVFGGRYMTDCTAEFPAEWFDQAKLCATRHDPALNYFGVNASQPLTEWRRQGWIHDDDPRGWFQWYCRYYLGRRSDDDTRQIKRWRAMRRHLAQIQKNCPRGDHSCRRKQRQALLHWAYDTRKI
jgi:hypothetical protein